MAKFLPMLGDMSGKLSDVVFSHNAAGKYVRPNSSPVDPQTGPQTVQRNILAGSAQHWGTLTDADRASWRSMAAGLPPRIDRLGQPYDLTGFQFQVQVNNQRDVLEQFGAVARPQLDKPPANWAGEGIVDFDASMISGAPGTLQLITYDGTDAQDRDVTGANDFIIVWAGKLLEPGPVFDKDLRMIGYIPENSDWSIPGTLDLTAMWASVYGTASFAVGQGIMLGLVRVFSQVAENVDQYIAPLAKKLVVCAAP